MSEPHRCGVSGCVTLTTRSVCAMHWRRMRRHGTYDAPPRRPNPLSEEWFAVPRYAEEDRGYTTPCWIWLRALDRYGYGFVGLSQPRRRTMRAHTVYYERRYGPVGEGLELDHLCRVPACVNPEHLEAVTHAENTRRGRVTQFTRADVTVIRESDDSVTQLARRYSVGEVTIWRIRTGRRWGPVEETVG